jgi:hypothetical protein
MNPTIILLRSATPKPRRPCDYDLFSNYVGATKAILDLLGYFDVQQQTQLKKYHLCREEFWKRRLNLQAKYWGRKQQIMFCYS